MPSSVSANDDVPLVEPFLIDGNLNDGEQFLLEHLAQSPDDDHARYGLGLLQFVQAVEQLGQSFHHHGIRNDQDDSLIRAELPFLRLPIPYNDNPEPITYEALRSILGQFVDDVMKAESTLAQVESRSLKLRLHFAKFKLDIDGNGVATDDESLWKIYSALNRNVGNVPQEDIDAFVVAIDTADLYWLRGYCHLTSAVAECVLGYDFEESFNVAAHAFFQNPEPTEAFYSARSIDDQFAEVADWIAMIHTVRWPVESPERLSSAHEHLLEVVKHSRTTWELITTEMDDDHEWIPSPDQTGVVSNVRINNEMVETWLEFVDEFESLLLGEKLIPFWADTEPTRGVNLRRAFEEPREFDAVLWSTGLTALPYLEEGDLSEPNTWARFQRIFGGQFIGFAIWFN